MSGRFRSFTDPDTHFEIVRSTTPHTDDGCWPGEPKELRCGACGASVEIDRDPSSPSVEELPHASDCPQRDTKSEWWWEQFVGQAD